MKKKILLSPLLILLLLSCGIGRNLSSPVSRMVGHWQGNKGNEYYFGPIGSQGVGELTVVGNGGSISFDSYQIYQEQNDGVAFSRMEEGNNWAIIIPPDGKTADIHALTGYYRDKVEELRYVDGKTSRW